jgi:hypothetical protein
LGSSLVKSPTKVGTLNTAYQSMALPDAQPRSRGFPEGLLDQPFYGWVSRGTKNKARFSGLLPLNTRGLN